MYTQFTQSLLTFVAMSNRLVMITALAFFSWGYLSASEPDISFKFGKGLTITDADSSISMNLAFSMQNFIAIEKAYDDDAPVNTTANVKRARLKFSGFAFTPKLEYTIQLGFGSSDMSRQPLLDAFINYKPTKHLGIMFGQTKLPGNREGLTSSSSLQFVDRSLSSDLFRLDRDWGLQLRGNFGNKVIFKPSAAVSTGEGRNIAGANLNGFCYTVRAELLPLGAFKSRGDYIGADVYREDKPKLAFGAATDLNHNPGTMSGQKGGKDVADSLKTLLTTVIADMIFKYKGLSISGEYLYRMAKTGNPYLTGQVFHAAAGYVCKKNFEAAFRFARSFPGDEGNVAEANHYTIGFSQYFKQHNLKVQTDYTIIDEAGVRDMRGIWRFHFQLAI
jgi:phosphate-selective porin OprO and OprP